MCTALKIEAAPALVVGASVFDTPTIVGASEPFLVIIREQLVTMLVPSEALSTLGHMPLGEPFEPLVRVFFP